MASRRVRTSGHPPPSRHSSRRSSTSADWATCGSTRSPMSAATSMPGARAPPTSPHCRICSLPYEPIHSVSLIAKHRRGRDANLRNEIEDSRLAMSKIVGFRLPSRTRTGQATPPMALLRPSGGGAGGPCLQRADVRARAAGLVRVRRPQRRPRAHQPGSSVRPRLRAWPLSQWLLRPQEAAFEGQRPSRGRRLRSFNLPSLGSSI